MAAEIKEPIAADDKNLVPDLDHAVVAEAGDTELLGMLTEVKTWNTQCADGLHSNSGVQAGAASSLLDCPDLRSGI